jgi:DNA-binding NarL/FixJ family response regulator
MNILIVEDNWYMRRILVHLLRESFPATRICEAADPQRALSVCSAMKPDLVLMDIDLPDARGMELTAQVASLLPPGRVVVMSSCRSRQTRDTALQAGAAAYVQKDDIYETLVPVLGAICDQPNDSA